ncbi:MAG: hypothetical protein K0Q73_8900 [Paenibacillus sp.]|nr:hypothetical protein [Paenibacillus sp.]
MQVITFSPSEVDLYIKTRHGSLDLDLKIQITFPTLPFIDFAYSVGLMPVSFLKAFEK